MGILLLFHSISSFSAPRPYLHLCMTQDPHHYILVEFWSDSNNIPQIMLKQLGVMRHSQAAVCTGLPFFQS